MKEKRTIKGRIAALRLAAAVMVAALCVSSCGNDEGEPTVGKEDVAVRLYMTNSDGVESETFRYGEEMVFNLTVDNNSEKAFTIAGLGHSDDKTTTKTTWTL